MQTKQESGQGKLPSEAQKKAYGQMVEQMTPTHPFGMQLTHAFVTGGLFCVLGQAILDAALYLGIDKETAPGVCSVCLILLSVTLTGFGLYSKLVKWGGAGALVPITGFANGVASCAIEFSPEGQVFGIGSKIFNIAGPVILYGIFSSSLLGLIYWLMKCFG